uniref:Variant surface glycoprotein 1715 n=1 Tax=Trypanosoma brucei TaxID=5691 RepID=M4SW38_9TRYP|nr:variant surface glycoprotein 1715 [Trypanosoma brucei]
MATTQLCLLVAVATITFVPAAAEDNCTAATHKEIYVGELQKKLANKHTADHTLKAQLIKAQLIAALAATTQQKLQAQAIVNLYRRCIERETIANRKATVEDLTKLADMALHFGRHDALKHQQATAVKPVAEQQANTGSAVVKAITLKGGTPGLTSSRCHLKEYSKATKTGDNHQHWAKQQLTLKKVEAVAGADRSTQNAARVCVGAQNNECTQQGAYVSIQGGKLSTTTAANPPTGAKKKSPADLTIFVGSDEKAQQFAVLDTELMQAARNQEPPSTSCNPHEQLEDLEFLEDAAAAADPGHNRPKADSSNKQNL